MQEQPEQRALTLIQSAQDMDSLSPRAATILRGSHRDISQALMTPEQVAQIPGRTPFLVTQLIDDSGSVLRHADLVRKGHNAVIDALRGAPNPDSIRVHTKFLNKGILFPFVPLSQAIRLDESNYYPKGGTPLYDEVVSILGTVMTTDQECTLKSKEANTGTLIVSDGLDESSVEQTAVTVRTLITEMKDLRNHIISAMGIGKPEMFRRMFIEMGIEEQWILTPGSTDEEIRRAFGLFATAAREASVPSNFPLLMSGGFNALKKVE